MEVDRIISHVFGRQFVFPEAGLLLQDKTVGSGNHAITVSSLEKLKASISAALDRSCPGSIQATPPPGRIGPARVRFDVGSHVGTFIIGNDRLSLNSQSNFSSMRANVCVCQGKWQYELQLGSKGVMQIGWATIDCKFSQEKGVGDTADSYAYDGNRLRKWNMSTYKYGEAWLSGDIISCTVDLDRGEVEFFRNGRSMGVAFDHIRTGPGLAYFPAVSLAYTENLVANFGSTPFKYPVRGFRPLQDPPELDLCRASLLCRWLERYLPLYCAALRHPLTPLTVVTPPTSSTDMSPPPSSRAIFLAISAQIFHHLAPLLSSPYITEACLVPLLQQSCARHNILVGPHPGLMALLDMLWTFLEEFELKRCLEGVVICLLTSYRHAPSSLDFPHQKQSLSCLLALLEHTQTRKHLLRNVLFDKIRFPSFVHVKPLDERGLCEAIPKVWWECHRFHIPKGDEEAYHDACRRIKDAVDEIESMQVRLLRILLVNTDGNDKDPSSRSIFLRKFRLFLGGSTRSASVLQTPLPVTLCCFHRLLAAFWSLWAEEVGHPERVHIPCRSFYDGTINYHGVDRLGGVLSHLRKALREEVTTALGGQLPPQEEEAPEPPSSTSFMSVSNAISGVGGSGSSLVISVMADVQQLLDVVEAGVAGRNSAASAVLSEVSLATSAPDKECQQMDSERSLTELLDGIVMLYHAAAHKQLAKVSTLRENMAEYVEALDETERKMAAMLESAGERSKQGSEEEEQEVRKQLVRSRAVFGEKLAEQSRHMAWVIAVVYSAEKQKQVAWLLRSVLATLTTASQEGVLFSFVPGFYLEAAIESCNALRTYFNPVTPMTRVPDHESLLTRVASFLSTHFADPRVVHAESKDSLIQALSSFACHEPTLRALERMKPDGKEAMTRALLRPYENRPWAQSNWILVRMWQGNGYGFRYTKSPHLAGGGNGSGSGNGPGGKAQMQGDSAAFTQTLKPCPSPEFQALVGRLLLEDERLAPAFLNSLLNQLNWAFSEFIGMLQEIQNASNRPERIFIESRQLKICATCFDLALALLRVLEMVVKVALDIFIDPGRPTSDPLLSRLCQLLCQVLNRVSSRSGCFDHVIGLDIPGLETVGHYPVLTAAAGILTALIEPEVCRDIGGEVQIQDDGGVPVATKALLSEPSFQLASLHFLLGDEAMCASAAPAGSKGKAFSLRCYLSDVSEEELSLLESTIAHLEKYQKVMSHMRLSLSEDDLCTICYAYPISAEFRPCKHHSCRSCIAHHLMNHTDCFFCKAQITSVVDPTNESTVLHDLSDRQQQFGNSPQLSLGRH